MQFANTSRDFPHGGTLGTGAGASPFVNCLPLKGISLNSVRLPESLKPAKRINCIQLPHGGYTNAFITKRAISSYGKVADLYEQRLHLVRKLEETEAKQ